VEAEPCWEIDSHANEYDIDAGVKFDAIVSLNVNDIETHEKMVKLHP